MSLDRLKREAERYVDQVAQLIDGPFIIAGGCLRDALLGGDVKDIDAFIPFNDQMCNACDYPESDVWYVNDLILPLSYSGEPVQEIVLNANVPFTLEGVTSRIDIGICRIAIDQDKNLYLSEAAARDLQNHTLTVLRTNGKDDRRVRERIQRFQRKYPSMGIVWALENEVE